MATNPHISLVFVNYHSIWQLSLALRQLFHLESNHDFFEVIVVNNDHREARALARLARKFPIRLLEQERNLGFGRAANIGAASARGSILGFLNPDTVWQKESLRRIESTFQEHSNGQILGLWLMNAQGEREPFSAGVAPTLWQLVRSNFFPFLVRQDLLQDAPCDWVSGGGLFIEKRIFQELQGFDERFFLYFEDVDLCLRAKEQGVLIVSEPRFTLLHHGGKSFVSRELQKSLFYSSQIRYFEKHRPFFEVFCVRLFHFFFRHA
ncbi:MAG: glycosyltransferase [Candidatus Moranbacteria bacterium]|nr:glycosyltransferase [Candidatus Moranbacteria bacterium]